MYESSYGDVVVCFGFVVMGGGDDVVNVVCCREILIFEIGGGRFCFDFVSCKYNLIEGIFVDNYELLVC